jgi:hypothetical protein
MAMLANLTITTAVTAQVTAALQARDSNPESVVLQANFTYGSGGTTATAWVQTSFDEGQTWVDIANFAFTTSSARATYNLSALTPVTTQYTPTDGTLASNTAKDGQVGNLFRVKYSSTGTYAGNTTLRIDAIVRGRLTSLT